MPLLMPTPPQTADRAEALHDRRCTLHLRHRRTSIVVATPHVGEAQTCVWFLEEDDVTVALAMIFFAISRQGFRSVFCASRGDTNEH